MKPRYALAMAHESMEPLDFVAFDLDGTLVDSLPDIADALNHALTSQGLAPQALEVVATLVGDGIVALAERALAVQAQPSKLTAVELSKLIWARYLERPCVLTKPYDGVMPVLRALQARQVPMAVLTNKPGDVARPLLEALGLTPFFIAIVGDNDGFPRKPDPTALLQLMSRVKAAPQRTLMVGDGVPDVLVAKAAGCVAVAALWGYSPRAVLLQAQPHNALMAPQQVLDVL